MTSPTIQIPLDVALDLPAESLRRLVDPERLREHLIDMGPAWAAWLLGADKPAEVVSLNAVKHTEPEELARRATLTHELLDDVRNALLAEPATVTELADRAKRPLADTRVALSELLAKGGAVREGKGRGSKYRASDVLLASRTPVAAEEE